MIESNSSRCNKSRQPIKDAEVKYNFAHQTFLEYFAALWFWENWSEMKAIFEDAYELPIAFLYFLLQELIRGGENVKALDNDSRTALHYAAREGYLDCLKLLIKAGADLNAKENDGWTALHWAARNGKLDCVKALIEAGADLNAQKNDGWTALHLAAVMENLTV